MKTVVLADLHLTDDLGTVKTQVLTWALAAAERAGAELLCCIGDLTAQGSDRQTAEVLRRLRSAAIPCCSTPGNAELRMFPDGRNAVRFAIPPAAGIPVVMIDTAANEPPPEELAKLESLPDRSGFLLATHNPTENWSESARRVFQDALRRGAVTAVIAGHSHHDAEGILRGLDPDKASGGPPMAALLEQLPDRSWKRSDLVMPGVDPSEWEERERSEFRRSLGVSSMGKTAEALEFAVRHGIENVELRPPVEECPATTEAICKWRGRGGRILSLHLPDLDPRNDGSELRRHVALAHRLGCDRVTLHVPRITAARFAEAEEALLERFGRDLRLLLENGVTVGIENLHTRRGETAFETRNFGCTIEECRGWILKLRERFGTDRIGFHLDIGHARNNAPISQGENLSDWYAALGDFLNGWHLHQVKPDAGSFLNHHPLTGFYDKLISLGGMFLALNSGQLPRRAPMFLESREWEGNVKAYAALTALLSQSEVAQEKRSGSDRGGIPR